MFDKIYTNDNSENVRIFDDIESRKNFSTYSLELNRLFGDKSYEVFHKNLIDHKRAKCTNFISMFQKPKNMAGMKIYDEPFNIASFEEALNNMKSKADKIKYRVENKYISRPPVISLTKTKTEKILELIKDKRIKKSKTSKIKLKKGNVYLPEVPDIGRYNPSYDILRKHTYQACFSTSNFHEFNKNCQKFTGRNLFGKNNDNDYNKNSNNSIFNNKNIKPINITTDDINNISKSDMENMNKKNKKLYLNSSNIFKNKIVNLNNLNKLKDELNNSSNNMSDSQILIRTNGDNKSRCQKHINNLYNTSSNLSLEYSKINFSNFNSTNNSINNLKNNHCLRFSNYSKRKPMINKLNTTTDHFINVNAYNMNFPSRNKNTCIEFNKLSTGKFKQKCFFEVEALKNNSPPIGAYNPRFESTFTKMTKNIFLNTRSPLPMTKKRKLKKIMFDYNVPSKYLLFQELNKRK